MLCCLCICLQARIWAASIGFSLLFGPMLAKAVRVYFVVTRSEKDLKQRVRMFRFYIIIKCVANLEYQGLAIDSVCGNIGGN